MADYELASEVESDLEGIFDYTIDRWGIEQAYRYNNRNNANDFDRFRTAAAHVVGKRLSWKQVVGLQECSTGRPN